jgi:hypothetical protein
MALAVSRDDGHTWERCMVGGGGALLEDRRSRHALTRRDHKKSWGEENGALYALPHMIENWCYKSTYHRSLLLKVTTPTRSVLYLEPALGILHAVRSVGAVHTFRSVSAWCWNAIHNT